MKYLAVLATLVCAPVSAQRPHDKRVADKAKTHRVQKCDKECKCVCHHSKRKVRGDQKDRRRGPKRGTGRPGGVTRRGKTTRRSASMRQRFHRASQGLSETQKKALQERYKAYISRSAEGRREAHKKG